MERERLLDAIADARMDSEDALREMRRQAQLRQEIEERKIAQQLSSATSSLFRPGRGSAPIASPTDEDDDDDDDGCKAMRAAGISV